MPLFQALYVKRVAASLLAVPLIKTGGTQSRRQMFILNNVDKVLIFTAIIMLIGLTFFIEIPTNNVEAIKAISPYTTN